MSNPIEIIDLGPLQVNKAFKELLLQNRLHTFESFMTYPHVEIVKQAVKERSTARVVLHDGRHERTFFLKRHTAPSLKEYLKQVSRLSWPKSAFNEWRAIIRFHQVGLPTMVPVAAGKKRGRFGIVTQSFLLTEGVEDAHRLDHYWAMRLKVPLSREQILQKRGLIKRLAHLTRKMHSSGLNHRDYYLCHVFIREGRQKESSKLFVLDLHRVDIRSKVGKRWIVKDLAALNYSSHGLPIQTTDRLRFLKCYLGKDRLERRDLRLLRQILKKTERIARHTEKR